MDDHHQWAYYAFFVSIFMLFVFSLYRISLELISSKEISAIIGKSRKFIEYLHASQERVDLTLGQIIVMLITIIAFCSQHVLGQFFESRIQQPYVGGVSLVAILVIIIVLYYIIPLMASSMRVSILRMLSPSVKVLVWLFKPTTTLIYRFKTLAFNMENSNTMNTISMDDLSDAVEIVSKASTPEDKRIITGMARFANADVSDIMCHRTNMVALNVTTPYNEVIEVVKNSGFSRIPVYRDVLDNIVGVLYVKDLIPNIDRENFDWVSIIRKPYFVSDTRMINELLVKFQKKKIHLAIVVDEYGSTLGIVSLEDILEEIVGEIEDESDIEEPFYSKLDENTYIFEGKTAVSDFIGVLDIDPDDIEDIRGEAETLAGLIVELKRDMPRIGAKVNLLNYCLTIVKLDKQRIDRVKVSKRICDASDN